MGVTGLNMSSEHLIQIICANPELTREYIHELQKVDESFHLRPIAWLAEAHQVRAEASVFLLDESGVEGQSQQAFEWVMDRLVEAAPVIVVAAPERQSELTFLLGCGAADFVARTGDFVPIGLNDADALSSAPRSKTNPAAVRTPAPMIDPARGSAPLLVLV